MLIAVGVGAWAIGKTQAEAAKGPQPKPESNAGGPPPQSGYTGQEHQQQQHHHQQQHQHHYQQQQHKYPGAPPPFHGQAPPTPPQPEYHEPQTPPQSPRPPPAAEPEAAPPPPPPPPPPPRTNPAAASGWEKAREETRKREEERRRAEEVRKKREEAQRIREEAEKAAKVKAEKEKWEQARAREKETREKEARERIIKERLAREKEAREKADKEKADREKAEKEKADRDKAVHDRLQQLEKEKAERDRADREKALREQAEKEKAERILAAAQTAAQTAAGGSVRSPLKPTTYQQPSARSHIGTEDEHSYRPYDAPPRSGSGPKTFHTAGSSISSRSESSYAASHSTSRTTPPPSHRGPYSTDDPTKIQVRAVYQFTDAFPGKPRAQLISGQGAVTDGLVLRIETEGLFIDDDVRGVPQREWDVKAWTLKSVEYSGKIRILGTGIMGPAAGGVLQVIRASLRDGENRRYCFVLEERESWKVDAALVRLKKGSQVRSLSVGGMKEGEARGVLGGVGWV
jgi:hypothetical protein